MATDFFLIRAIFAFAGFVSALKSMPIHHTAGELSRPFGLVPSTASAKAAEIRKRVRLPPLDAPWPLPELIEGNPALWTFSLNGFIAVSYTHLTVYVDRVLYARRDCLRILLDRKE